MISIKCDGDPIKIAYEEERIFTVFPADSDYLPQDFTSYSEALVYAKSLGCDYEIEEG